MITDWFSKKSEIQMVSEDITQVYIELSTYCNLSCRTCVRNSIRDFKHRHFTRNMMNRLMPSLKEIPSLRRIIILGFGEALCNPDIHYLLRTLNGTGVRIVLVTNAHLLTEEMSEFITMLPVHDLYISWDDPMSIRKEGMTRRGSDLNKTAENIKTLINSGRITGSIYPETCIEIVATKSNYLFINEIINYWSGIGVHKFIVTNLFPYTEEMEKEILYSNTRKNIEIDFNRIIKKRKKNNVLIANQAGDINRRCPFIEKGTLFITVEGDIAPCPELAYTHNAIYFGMQRLHNAYITGNIHENTLLEVWNNKNFSEFRNNFSSFFFQDCSTCYRPDLCKFRMSGKGDCYEDTVPCGECLWARNIIICP